MFYGSKTKNGIVDTAFKCAVFNQPPMYIIEKTENVSRLIASLIVFIARNPVSFILIKKLYLSNKN